MLYRVADQRDWGAIVEFVTSFDYFSPIDIETLHGHWIIAEAGDEVRGTVWFFAEPPHMYVDYWAASNPVIAARIGAVMKQFCEENKIRYVHGLISERNTQAERLAVNGLGFISMGPYNRVYREVEPNGNGPDSRTEDTDSRGERSGAQHHSSASTTGSWGNRPAW